ncbi:MAG: DUF4139 domain-containing protein [Phycisphaerales bacterium]
MGRASTWAMVMVAGTACTAGLVAMGAGRGTTTTAAPGAPASADLNLPVTSITLYRSGVASYERRGTVRGDVHARMSVEGDRINDLLKSMVLLDLDGGRVEAVSYESNEPLARRLSSFAIDISDNPGVYTLFERLRGAQVRLDTIAGGVEQGAVLSVESWPVVEDGVSVPRGFVTLRTDQGLRTIGLHEVKRFQLVDERLADEVRRALEAMNENRAEDAKSVELSFAGEGERRVVVSYVQEAPVWKASYRLVLPEDSASEATLQGWAIVENTTDEDWREVNLSLVSGRPVSFTMDLYEPLYVPRYEAPVPVAAGARPRVYAEGAIVGGSGGQSPFSGQTQDQYMNKSVRDRVEAQSRAAGRAPTSIADDATMGYEFEPSMLGAGVASGGEVGEQFRYALDAPVTIERRRSAMLPILTEPVKVRRVSIYAASDNAEHPMRGVELTNSTSLQLLAGPLSVYDAGAYAGDAQIGHVAPQDERLLAYAVDLDVVATTERKDKGAVEQTRIVKGVLEQKIKDVTTTRYTFTSKDRARPRTVVVEHPAMEGWDLVEPSKPSENTDGAVRFEVALAPGGDGVLAVTHERVRYQRFGVLGQDTETLMRYATQGRASQDVVDAVRRVGELQGAVVDARSQIARLEQERQEIAQDQERIRGNLGRVSSGTELHQRYLTKLNEQETRLEDIAQELERIHEREQAAQKALEQFVAGLSVG